MGNRSRSSTSSKVSDQRAGAEGKANIVLGGGGTINVEQVAPGFDRLLATGEEILGEGQEFNLGALNFVGEIAHGAGNLASQVTATAQQALATVAERQKEDETGVVPKDLLFLATGIGGAAVILFALKRK